MSTVVRTAAFVVLVVFWIGARGQDAQASFAGADLAALLDGLSRSASPEQSLQIVDAIGASPTLVRDFNDLAATHALTRIDVVAPPATGDAIMGPFSAAFDGSRIVVSSRLLTALRRGRTFDVVLRDEVLPNNTVFVLAHLAYHLEHPFALKPGAVDLQQWMLLKLTDEAKAFIHASNATVEEATVRIGGTPLTGQQVGSMMLNSRYRFAFRGIQARQIAAPVFAPAGTIEPTPANVDAIVQKLQQSSIADLQ